MCPPPLLSPVSSTGLCPEGKTNVLAALASGSSPGTLQTGQQVPKCGYIRVNGVSSSGACRSQGRCLPDQHSLTPSQQPPRRPLPVPVSPPEMHSLPVPFMTIQLDHRTLRRRTEKNNVKTGPCFTWTFPGTFGEPGWFHPAFVHGACVWPHPRQALGRLPPSSLGERRPLLCFSGSVLPLEGGRGGGWLGHGQGHTCLAVQDGAWEARSIRGESGRADGKEPGEHLHLAMAAPGAGPLRGGVSPGHR